MPASSESNSEYVFRLPRRALRIAGIAFGIGLLLFVIVWWMGRDHAFYKVETGATGDSADLLEALPEPLPGSAGASDMPDAGEPAERPQLVEAPAPALPAPLDETAPPSAPDATTPAPVAAAPAPGDQPVPIPGQSPPPEYPAAALRKGESGTVMVRVQVDSTGAPVEVSLERRSGSRDLDRAALEAVRGWRFQPAQREGRAVDSILVIPIDFKPGN